MAPEGETEGGSFSQNHAHAVLSQGVTIIHPNKNVAGMAAGAHCDSFRSFIRVGTRNPGNTGPLVLGGKNELRLQPSMIATIWISD